MRRSALLLLILLAIPCSAKGQTTIPGTSGVPGDGVPDIYFAGSDTMVMTSAGLIPLEAGTLVLDTDETDVVVFFVAGSNLIPHCEFCDGMNLPGSDALGGTRTWSSGFAMGSTQWLATNPLIGTGFRGVIGVSFIDGNDVVQPWPDDLPPYLDFPDHNAGFAQDEDFCATRIFPDSDGGMWQSLIATVEGEFFLTDIAGHTPPTCVPEPIHLQLGLLLLTLTRIGTRKL